MVANRPIHYPGFCLGFRRSPGGSRRAVLPRTSTRPERDRTMKVGKEGVRPVTGRTPLLCLEGYSKFCLKCAASGLGCKLTEVVLEAAPVVRQSHRICRSRSLSTWGTRSWMIEHVGRIDSQLHSDGFPDLERLRDVCIQTPFRERVHCCETEVALLPWLGVFKNRNPVR